MKKRKSSIKKQNKSNKKADKRINARPRGRRERSNKNLIQEL